MKKDILTSLVVTAVGVAVIGCAHQTTTKQAKTDDGQYEYVTPIGSNIPVRVRKGETAATSSPSGSLGTQDVAKMQQQSTVVQMGPPSGK